MTTPFSANVADESLAQPCQPHQSPKPFVIGAGLRGVCQRVWTHPCSQTRTMRVSAEFEEGQQAYADGIDGYAAKPYPELTQPMTDWFAGWLDARNADREEVAA